MNGILMEDQFLAGWALEVYASGNGKQVSVEPPNYSPDPQLPLVGLERNEPFRRLLGETGVELPATHLDPGVVYHSKGRTLVRPASVEGWIEACGEWFSGSGLREFWETVWNLSVAAWNFVDEFGFEPIDQPAGFPYCYPSFWQGIKRNRILFADAADYFQSFEVKPRDEFRRFVESLVQFAYGQTLAQVTVGMAAVALNAPSISYRLRREAIRTSPEIEPPDGKERGSAWRIGFRAGPRIQSGMTHQVFLDDRVAGPLGQSVVLTLENSSEGYLYFRSPGGDCESLDRALEQTLGKDWGQLERNRLTPVLGLVYSVGERPFRTDVEAEWPWLGPVRAYLEARRALV